MNGTLVKNQLIFDFASGVLGPAKSLFTSTCLQLNSNASKISTTFENMLGENLMDNENIHPKNLKYIDCINRKNTKSTSNANDPITSFFGKLENLNWKQVYKGFNEYSAANYDGFNDNYGENEDWFELYNASLFPINLNGYYVSDKNYT